MVYKMRQRRKDEFMVSFKRISISLKETYQMITFGGDAELELCDSLDPFSKGVNFRFVYYVIVYTQLWVDINFVLQNVLILLLI